MYSTRMWMTKKLNRMVMLEFIVTIILLIDQSSSLLKGQTVKSNQSNSFQIKVLISWCQILANN